MKFGRPTKLDDFQRREALTRLAAGEFHVLPDDGAIEDMNRPGFVGGHLV